MCECPCFLLLIFGNAIEHRDSELGSSSESIRAGMFVGVIRVGIWGQRVQVTLTKTVLVCFDSDPFRVRAFASGMLNKFGVVRDLFS